MKKVIRIVLSAIVVMWTITAANAQLVSIMDPLATITANPNNTTVCENGTTSFSTTATIAVGSLTYQWQENTGAGFANITNGGIYSNATTNTLTLTGATNAMNTYVYQCVVTTSIGGCSTNSNSAILTVNPLATFTVNPSNTTICENGNTSLTVTASAAGGVTYQWQENTGAGFNNLVNGGIYSNVTTNTLTFTGVTNAMNTYQYRCAVTTVVGNCSTNSTSATLTVNPLATITASPSNTTICQSANTTLSVTASATGGVTYQWQENTGAGFANIVNGGIYSNATTSNLTLTGVTNAMNTYQYRCAVTTVVGACSINSNAATLSVNPLATITSQPNNSTICANANTSLSVTANAVGGISHKWQVNSGAGWNDIVDGAIYTNSSTSTLNITGATLAMNGGLYRCNITTTIGSCVLASSQVTLTVNPNPVVPSITSNGAAGNTGHYCQGDPGTVFTLLTTQNLYQYQLQVDIAGTSIGAPVAGTGASISFPAQPTGNYQITATSLVGCTTVIR